MTQLDHAACRVTMGGMTLDPATLAKADQHITMAQKAIDVWKREMKTMAEDYPDASDVDLIGEALVALTESCNRDALLVISAVAIYRLMKAEPDSDPEPAHNL